ncbi:peroxiredoxin [Mucilaginibacter frigoritolerans]|uniref:Peroxiredoxin n=1 Tax=Mucilaginibacter frigoritolerans TaxID=652788 RepID=A0A562TNZ7_9SPHI|nr:TlpA disulfide reductase family protein [Mucilaginibacter frigoritolerans]TWI95291.1 peroxiredoxin [Mucilaginibacter frigoritolerans]
MKHIRFAICAALQLLILMGAKAQQIQTTTASNYDRGYAVKVGDQAPDDFELVLTDGTKTSLKQLRGKIVVLQFTASWCSVCREEIPHLESEVWKAFKDKNVVLIGIDRDEPLAKVQKYHQEMQVSYPFALDPGADIFGRFANKKSGVTRNVVIDAGGKIIYLTRLYNTDEFNAMVKVIDQQVNQPVAKTTDL